MSYWNAKYPNDHGEYEITFGSKTCETTKAVEKVCAAAMDGRVKSPEDVEVVVHAHWVDRYGYKYANKLYVCSRCGKKALFEIQRDELGHEHIVQSFTDRCPECGAYMDERYPDV